MYIADRILHGLQISVVGGGGVVVGRAMPRLPLESRHLVVITARRRRRRHGAGRRSSVPATVTNLMHHRRCVVVYSLAKVGLLTVANLSLKSDKEGFYYILTLRILLKHFLNGFSFSYLSMLA